MLYHLASHLSKKWLPPPPLMFDVIFVGNFPQPPLNQSRKKEWPPFKIIIAHPLGKFHLKGCNACNALSTHRKKVACNAISTRHRNWITFHPRNVNLGRLCWRERENTSKFSWVLMLCFRNGNASNLSGLSVVNLILKPAKDTTFYYEFVTYVIFVAFNDGYYVLC